MTISRRAWLGLNPVIVRASKGQVTIPQSALEETGLQVGDELKVDVEQGRIVLTPILSLGQRRRAAIRATAGSLPGVWEPGDLDRLRDEWR
jgi:bifunctional DNA-binding transcriptional regulator/antitoxin component of YhaV-PrlF toxin-antitoxin module